jgi:hypothetical protein
MARNLLCGPWSALETQPVPPDEMTLQQSRRPGWQES